MKLLPNTTSTILTILLVAHVSSCKKHGEDDCKTDMAHIAGKYKLTALSYKLNATAFEQSLYDGLDACVKDNVLLLNANGTYEYDDAGIVCTPNDNDTGTWSIAGNRVISDAAFVNGTLAAFNCRSLIIDTHDFITTGDRLTFTYTKQ